MYQKLRFVKVNKTINFIDNNYLLYNHYTYRV